VDPDSAGTSFSQWYVACANGSAATKWPYGNTFSATTCNGNPDTPSLAPVPVATFPACHGMSPPFDRVFDMSGNVEEWDDGCYQYLGATDSCALRGGYWSSNPATDLACDHAPTYPRNTIDERVGFRCCK
jgi:formylglycine-generating enzyme required for sulfatase activity